MTRRLPILTLALALVLNAVGFACVTWVHRWRTIQESWSSHFGPEIVVALKSACFSELGNITVFFAPVSASTTFDLAEVTVYPWNPDDPLLPDIADRKLANKAPSVAITPVLQQAHQLVAVDESLPLLSLVRIEDLTRTTMRWVKIDNAGNPITLDEKSVTAGFSLSVSAMPRWWPILRIDRYLGDSEHIASRSWLDGLIPVTELSSSTPVVLPPPR